LNSQLTHQVKGKAMTELVGRPMEILLVEDSLSDARLTLEALNESRIQHRLTIIHDGLEAMIFLRREAWFAHAPRPDLILLDLNLPRKDGWQILAEIRQDEDLRRIPVIILTASSSEEDQLRGQQFHVEGYLCKPVEREHFVALVRQLKEYWHADVILPASS
jgi:CheY-like chemotaxis protein